jgi:hypothetical protein
VTSQEVFTTLPKPWRVPSWFVDLGYYRNRQIGHFVKEQIGRVVRAQEDGIENVAPILLALRCDTDEAKRRVGKAVWRELHHSDLRVNVTRARILMRTSIKAADLIRFPQAALVEVVAKAERTSERAVTVAGLIADTRSEFREAVMLAHDTIRMGGDPSARWSLRRLREEHDRLADEWARAKSDPTPWGEPFSCVTDGYRFTLLNSGADFAVEGSVMRHCVASYREDARRGRYMIMKIEGPERATVRFGGDPVRVQEVKARFNAPVSDACRRACAKVASEHLECDYSSVPFDPPPLPTFRTRAAE